MVASCVGCNAMPFWAAYVTGMGAGAFFFSLRAIIDRFRGAIGKHLKIALVYFKLNIHFSVDDPLDAFAVHFGGGFFGMVSAPFLIDSGVLLVGDYKSAEVH